MGNLTTEQAIVPCSESHSHALAAHSVHRFAAFAGRQIKGIHGVIRMALRTVRTRCLMLSGISTLNVNDGGDWFKVLRIYATSHAAEMIQLEPIWNRADRQLMHQYMGAFVCPLASTDLDSPVASAQLPDPKPTSAIRFGNCQPQKSFEKCKLGGSHRDSSQNRVLVRAAQRLRDAVAACFYFTPAEAV